MCRAEKQPVEVVCGQCGVDWIVAYLPMALDDVAKLFAKLTCPRCEATSNNIYVKGGQQ